MAAAPEALNELSGGISHYLHGYLTSYSTVSLTSYLSSSLMPQANTSLSRLLERDREKPPLLPNSTAPTASSGADLQETIEVVARATQDSDIYQGLIWTRVPHLEKRQKDHQRGVPSWIYKYGWPLYDRGKQRNVWLCFYCHQYQISGGIYDVSTSTSSAASHLKQLIRGHRVNAAGPIQGNGDPNQGSILHTMRSSGLTVSQDIANELAGGFHQTKFLEAVREWIATDNQSLRVIENPAFRRLLGLANPLAEAALWRSHVTLRDTIVSDYLAYIPAVIAHLRDARSLIHISFDNWTSIGGKHALTGVCVHHLNKQGVVEDYLLGLPQLLGQHTGSNIATTVSSILQTFQIDQKQLGYFVLDNATNNDTAVEALATEYNFDATSRRLRCCCHIINLGAQVVIWGQDRDAFENEAEHLDQEEKELKVWRKYGPLGVLFDTIAAICTPQARQLLKSYQQAEADALGLQPTFKELIKPVKTRWNSYYAALARAAELHGPIDSFIEYKINEHNQRTRQATRQPRRPRVRQEEPPPPRLYIREDGLKSRDWATINEYIQLLQPFAEATRLLEGRGQHGRYGAIWEVLITFEHLLETLESHKERLAQINYDDPDAPEDHLALNINLAHTKLSTYYSKFDDAPIYYAATILHPRYKHKLKKLWAVPPSWDTLRDGIHYRDSWLKVNDRAFLDMWEERRDQAAKAATVVAATRARLDTSNASSRPLKKQRIGYTTSSTSYIDSSDEEGVELLVKDEYEQWKDLPQLSRDHPLAYDPISYWQQQATQYPVLSQLALDILVIPASAADCERTFSELGDMLGTRRLSMKPELIAALQCLKSWQRVGIRRPGS